MATSLKRKARKNRTVARKRRENITRLNSLPPVKNVDIEKVKEEFEQNKKSKKSAFKKEEKPEAKVTKAEEPKAVKKSEEETPKGAVNDKGKSDKAVEKKPAKKQGGEDK